MPPQHAILQLIDAELLVTPASLHAMAQYKFWEAVSVVLKKSPALGLARHNDKPVWFAMDYELAASFIPKTELHRSTTSMGFTYLMHRLNMKGSNINDLPLSSDPAVGFDPNHLAEGKIHSLTPLAIAMATSDLLTQAKQVDLLLEAGADPNLTLKSGTLLSYMRMGNSPVLEALIDEGVSPRARGPKGDLSLVELVSYPRDLSYNCRTEVANAMVKFMDPADFTKSDLKKLVKAGHCEVTTVVLRWLLENNRGELIRDTQFDSYQKWIDENLAVLE